MSSSSSSSPANYPGIQFANIMVEFETDTREMAVDVPDSFVGVSKTPPKYPPPKPSNGDTLGRRTGTPNGKTNGRSPGSSSSPSSSVVSLREESLPTPQQSLRIKKYSEDFKKRQKKAQEQQLLRVSVRNSAKMRELKEGGGNIPNGVCNMAYQEQNDSSGLIVLPEIEKVFERLLKNPELPDISSFALGIVKKPEFKNAVTLHNKVKSAAHIMPISSDSFELAEEISEAFIGSSNEEWSELGTLLRSLEGLFVSHDKISSHIRYFKNLVSDDDILLDRLSHYSEPNIKIVKIEKSQEPLGATVKNEDDAVVIGRIIRGGVAERSGLLNEGDEILEVNEVELRGKNVNEVCDILSSMTGTLTLLVVPTRQHIGPTPKTPMVHIKSHIDYDPEDDPCVPCRELALSFQKGDILHVINQSDPLWWQAFRDGEDDHTLPGLIPSSNFQQQREAMKQTIAQDSEKYVAGARPAVGGFLCAKKSGRKKRRKVPHFPEEEVDSDGIVTYEEVALYYPRADKKRPIVLIGPPNIGRHELRQKLMTDANRFASALPHTSRPKRSDEIDGQDYHFISRIQFEQDILSRKFVEHGEYEKSYYGTSLEAIRSVVQSGKICVLNLHPQSLKILKSSDLMPYVVFVAPPSLEKLKKWKMDQSGGDISHEGLKETIERAREIEDLYGHYFDMVIVCSDPNKAYTQLLNEINLLEREPQWVPMEWQHYF